MTKISQFGIEACLDSVRYFVEELHEDPVALLGEFTLRARQDPYFNTKMIDAINEYIDSHNISWRD